MSVAIVMPYYNDKQLLVKSVMGVLGQTYQDWELLLVDDGSARGNKAVEILPSNITKRIRVIEKSNGGVSSARNLALDLIRNENRHQYVAYCDSDDMWEENYLKEQLEVLKNTEYDLVYSTVQYQMIDGSPAFPFGIPFYDEFPGTATLVKGNFMYISSIVHKIDCLNVGNFDSNLNSIEDWDMWARMSEAGFKFKRNKNTGIIYTCKTDGMGSRANASLYNAFFTKHAVYNNTNS
jgi:glycosyltransferase involved in cell wall biosynthesis